MKTEFERIFYEIDLKELENKLESIGAKNTKKRFLQKRVVYDFGRVEEGKYFHFLRLRDEGDRVTLTYKRVGDGKFPLENEIAVSDFQTMKNMLSLVGLKETSYQENFREIFMYDGTQITLDEWPYLDTVCEVESESEEKMHEMIEKLNLNIDKSFNTNVNSIYKLKYGKYIEDLGIGVEIGFDKENPFVK